MWSINILSEHPLWFRFVVHVWQHTARYTPASFPGSCVGEEEREPGTHCLRMRQVPLIKLRSVSVYLLKAILHGYTPCETHVGGTEVRNNITLMERSALLCLW